MQHNDCNLMSLFLLCSWMVAAASAK